MQKIALVCKVHSLVICCGISRQNMRKHLGDLMLKNMNFVANASHINYSVQFKLNG